MYTLLKGECNCLKKCFIRLSDRILMLDALNTPRVYSLYTLMTFHQFLNIDFTIYYILYYELKIDQIYIN